jgi:hypothetical protein
MSERFAELENGFTRPHMIEAADGEFVANTVYPGMVVGKMQVFGATAGTLKARSTYGAAADFVTGANYAAGTVVSVPSGTVIQGYYDAVTVSAGLVLVWLETKK